MVTTRLTRRCSIFLAFAAGCAPPALAPAGSGASQIVVDGTPVGITGGESLLDVLRGHVGSGRLGLAALPEGRPLVIVDGTILADGAPALAHIPAFHVAEVTVLRHVEAVAVHGVKARNGAIIVQTKRGR